jgi:alkaline phosphatase
MFSSCPQIGRRAFVQNGVIALGAVALSTPEQLFAVDASARLRFALMTDMHFADKPAAGTRYYRDTLSKLSEAARQLAVEKPSFVVELGDFIDAAESVEVEQLYLSTINGEFSKLASDRHYVLGNHCVDTLTKSEFLSGVGQAKSYYSFDRGDFHFVVLDACFCADGRPYGRKVSHWTDANVPDEELKWLAADLAQGGKKTIVFAHQRLDVTNNHGVKNNQQVRGVLEAAGNVLAVFQGHSHANDLKDINGIHYCTLVAMVEGSGVEQNGYSVVDLSPDGTILLSGFRKQASYRWPRS